MASRKGHFLELDRLYAHLQKAAKELAGFPASQLFNYSELFHFLKFHINNIGDPFQNPSHYRINTLNIERQVIDRFAELFHAPKDDYWGYVTNGGTEGNLFGLYTARELYPDGVVFYSDQTHYSIPKNVKILRMQGTVVKSTVNGEIDYQDLQRSLLTEKKVPIIVANIGTTMKGAVDDVVRIKEILSDLGIKHYYLHCDAAFFGMTLPFLPELEVQPFDFRMDIDSIAISGHKMIGTPIPCGVILTRKSNQNAIGSAVEYIGTKDNTITGSRNGLSPLFLWYELHCAQKVDFHTVIHACIEKAGYAVKKFNEIGIEAWRNKNSIIVIFPKPSEKVFKKWQLAVENDIAHIITLPHVTFGMIDQIVDHVAADLKIKKNGKNGSSYKKKP